MTSLNQLKIKNKQEYLECIVHRMHMDLSTFIENIQSKCKYELQLFQWIIELYYEEVSVDNAVGTLYKSLRLRCINICNLNTNELPALDTI